jgi:hypothetical protein
MGKYVNPHDTSKEEWLSQHGEVTNGPCAITESHVPVCLVNNGMFTAAGVADYPSEVEAFSQPRDYRLKTWYRVSRADLQSIGAL